MVMQARIRGAGLSLSVTERGERGSPTVVLVHGFPDTSSVWRPVAERLAAELHVVSYDVRGAGRSDAPTDRAGYALPLLVEDLAAVVDGTSPDAPVHLVAHDWGSIQGWEAVTTRGLADRFASFTSISGPPLDHAALWARRHRTLNPGDLRQMLTQALHSWYIAYFGIPLLPELMTRSPRVATLWAAALHRVEHAQTDGNWPAPTFGVDFSHGVELYRANVFGRMRRPVARRTEVPVQLIVPGHDRYVTPALLDGLEEWTSLMWRRPVDAGHWVIRSNPDGVAAWVREVVSYVEDGVESDALRRHRIRSIPPAA
ncbi:MAG: alpha/beta fold hydrolase [Acidimicrobiales bacterium]|jgi:pimeloyl-ACP methyl ester carboxylesterase